MQSYNLENHRRLVEVAWARRKDPSNAYEALEGRGFVKQETSFEELIPGTGKKAAQTIGELLGARPVTYYVGFDATADSLHIGSLLPIMAMAHLQRAGHVPICIIGGGTTMIGDPSGKTQMRQMLAEEAIASNGKRILGQLKQYLEFGEGKGLFLNNADWLLPLNYIAFLRDIGRHFRVNEMIKAEGYRLRLEREEGLSFVEFNYQLLQAYDFLVLFENYGCVLQMGGDDQWGNILAGIDLIRKVKQRGSCAMTFPLLTTARGQKMGKTESGAVWLDPAKTSPYDFYQFWVNTDDRDVEKFLKYFTFLPLPEIAALCSVAGSDLRQAKEKLAYEATRITHGDAEAEKALSASKGLFSGSGDLEHVPTTSLTRPEVATMKVVELLVRVGFCSSKNEAARLIAGGGISANAQRVQDGVALADTILGPDGSVLLRKGKKTFHRVVVR